MKFLTAVVAAALLFVGGATSILAADTPPAPAHVVHHHPRRRQVNRRLKRQNARIRRKVRHGKMSRREAARLHKHDREIRHEEKDMAAQDGGHITKQDQNTLNQQENQNSKEIQNH
ncbi:MAG TPA: hypothetical protein VK914_05905 [bacterium]|jgi:hypothetical protein|nr:hypothetical protein [bacterium]